MTLACHSRGFPVDTRPCSRPTRNPVLKIETREVTGRPGRAQLAQYAPLAHCSGELSVEPAEQKAGAWNLLANSVTSVLGGGKFSS